MSKCKQTMDDDEYEEYPYFSAELKRVNALAPPHAHSQTMVASKKKFVVQCALKVLTEAIECDCFQKQDGQHIVRIVASMLLDEITLSRCKHMAFYRVISEKWVAYAINTAILHLMGLTTREEDGSLSLIPTPCILEEAYPVSMEDLHEMFKKRAIQSDMSPECFDFMISTNCSLLPQGHDRSFHMGNLRHSLEAHPARFYNGYDITSWIPTMMKTFHEVFGLDSEPAERLLDQICELYNTHFQPNDTHVLQISIPDSQLERFAYMCVAYGYSVKVFEDPDGKRTAYYSNATNIIIQSDGKRVLGMHDILACPEVAKLQTRIIAHPNLFLLHGATVSVHSSRPGFHSKEVQDGIIGLLQPYVARMVLLPRFDKFS